MMSPMKGYENVLPLTPCRSSPVLYRFNTTSRRPEFNTQSFLRECKIVISRLQFLVEKSAGFVLFPVVGCYACGWHGFFVVHGGLASGE